MDKSDELWINNYFKEENMSKDFDFMEIGEAYSGKSPAGKSYIRLHLDEATASDISYSDLCEKIYLFKNTSGNGQFTAMGIVKKKD